MLVDPYGLLKEAMIKESPFLCEKTKAECICYLGKNKNKMTPKDMTFYSEDQLKIISQILKLESAELIYEKFGNLLSVQEMIIPGVYFREDCLEYLLFLGVKLDVAFKITDSIRKGMWKRCETGIYLPDAFVKWADGVEYLPSRAIIFEKFSIQE